MQMPPAELFDTMMSRYGADLADEMAIPSYRHRNPLMRWMAMSRLDQLCAWAGELATPGCRIVDYGCGTGVLFPVLSPLAAELVGVDLRIGPAQMLIDHYRLSNVRLMEPGGLDQLPDDSVDLLVAGEVLEHIEDLDPLLATFRRLVPASGHLLVTAPTENGLYRLGRRLAGFSGEYHVTNAGAILRQLVASGFRVARRRSLPLPGPAAIYLALDLRTDG